MDRAYTVAEIDALRQACDTKWVWGTFAPKFSSRGPSYGMSQPFREEDRAKGVEEMVRTYMYAGLTASDLYASESSATPSEKP